MGVEPARPGGQRILVGFSAIELVVLRVTKLYLPAFQKSRQVACGLVRTHMPLILIFQVAVHEALTRYGSFVRIRFVVSQKDQIICGPHRENRRFANARVRL